MKDGQGMNIQKQNRKVSTKRLFFQCKSKAGAKAANAWFKDAIMFNNNV